MAPPWLRRLDHLSPLAASAVGLGVGLGLGATWLAGPGVGAPLAAVGLGLAGYLTYSSGWVLVDPKPPKSKVPVPPWADGAGEDKYGRWAEVKLNGVKFKLRWIPPGEFLMGSPETEVGRYEHEGPQHRVILTEGFWLGETPVTQKLWQAVTGNNPSLFKSPTRPVEMVSWDAIQKFLAAVERLRPGLKLGLPSEAQWEYAARAGTTQATYAGDLKAGEEISSALVDNLGWYERNSVQESHPVGEKLANPWGLYDMLGNVWEWCRDGQRRYGAEVVTNPLGPEEPGVARVVRGGSWGSLARSLRAAYRRAFGPGYAYDRLGFRLCRGQ